MMISLYLKNGVLTTQLRTIIMDLKPKTKEDKKNISKNLCVLHLVCRNSLVKLVSKKSAFPVQCRTKQKKFEGSNFLKWASIAPTESCVTYLLSD